MSNPAEAVLHPNIAKVKLLKEGSMATRCMAVPTPL